MVSVWASLLHEPTHYVFHLYKEQYHSPSLYGAQTTSHVAESIEQMTYNILSSESTYHINN